MDPPLICPGWWGSRNRNHWHLSTFNSLNHPATQQQPTPATTGSLPGAPAPSTAIWCARALIRQACVRAGRVLGRNGVAVGSKNHLGGVLLPPDSSLPLGLELPLASGVMGKAPADGPERMDGNSGSYKSQSPRIGRVNGGVFGLGAPISFEPVPAVLPHPSKLDFY